ncbi:MAG: hypothetical protein WAQ98_14240 [Blastocatellia bacterium]
MFDLITSPLATASFYLFQVPGLPNAKIPGLSDVYMPTDAAAKAFVLFEDINKIAFLLLPLLLLIAGGMSVVGLGEQWTIWEMSKRAIATVILLVGIQFVYGGVISLGVGIGEVVINGNEAQKLNQRFEKVAKQTQDERGVDSDKPSGWIELGALIIGGLSTNQLMTIVTGLANIFFFVLTIVMTNLWRIFAIILFVISPLTVVLGIIPGIGSRITANWFGALVQISFWQIWFSICAWFVNNAELILTYSDVTSSRSAVANYAESTAFAVVFSFLYLATPFIVSAIVPLSIFSSVGVTSLISVTNLVIGGASKLIPK